MPGRKGGYHLRIVIDTGKKYGMCTMTESIGNLLEANFIVPETAKRVLVNYS
jgi:hypothetical protein